LLILFYTVIVITINITTINLGGNWRELAKGEYQDDVIELNGEGGYSKLTEEVGQYDGQRHWT